MTCGSNTLLFTYGADGSPLSLTYNGTTYYYVVNLQGDVVAILNSSGAKVVSYTYDAWGRLLTTSVVGTANSNLALHNPLRYRGYVYDRETGLYYLQSRYYNPTIGRFINADTYASTGHDIVGHNMFVYCQNNPTMYRDPNGQFSLLVIGVLAAFTIGGVIVGALSNEKLGPTSDENKSQETEDSSLTAGDRVGNALIGGLLGLAVGGAVVSVGGAIGTVAVGSGTTQIALFGATGMQTFAIGALAYDIPAMIIGPLYGTEMELIEPGP